MKMTWGLFWGIMLVLIGLSLVVKVVFKIDFPIVKIVFAFIFIYLGIKILIGDRPRIFNTHRDDYSVVFGETSFDNIQKDREYNIVFGQGSMDLRQLKPDSNEVFRVKLNTVFGESKVLINKDVPVQIRANSAFGEVSFPNKNSVAFGNSYYASDSLDTSKAYIEIESNTVFGATKVVENE
jgi:predicted membrane protein